MTVSTELDFPFEPLNGDLGGCVIHHDLPDDAERSPDSWFLHPDDLAAGFRLRLEMKCDWEGISRDTSYSTDRLDATIRIKNADARLFQTLARWPILDVPSEWEPSPALHPGMDFEIVVAVVTNSVVRTLRGTELYPGSELLSKGFSFSSGGPSFPIKYADFSHQGWPDAPWNVDLDPDSTSMPPEECLTIELNQKLRPLFEVQRGPRRVTTEVFARTCCNLIVAEISRRAVPAYEPETGVDGLLEVLDRLLCGEGDRSLAKLKAMVDDDQDEFNKVVLDRLATASTLTELVK